MPRDQDFRALEPWIQGLADQIKPNQMKGLARRIGMHLRRANSKRIAANVEPDGTPMEPRKPKKPNPLPDWLEQRIAANPSLRKKFGKGKKRRKEKTMFPRLRMARMLEIHAQPDGVSLNFGSKAGRASTVHHFGLSDRVDDRRGPLRARYPARRLLGFSPGDEDVIAEAVMEHLDKMGK